MESRQLTAAPGHTRPSKVNDVTSLEDPVASSPDATSMHDMLRIMDVASALRRQRETAEAQLDVETARQRLRERLLATAAAAGEPVTPNEVDAAIASYFANQHRYEDPPASWARFWAQVWVLRNGILLAGVVLCLAAFGAAMIARSLASEPETRPAPVIATTAGAPAPHAEAPLGELEASGLSAPPAVDTGLADDWRRYEQATAAAEVLAADDDAHERVRSVVALGAAAHAAEDRDRLRQARRELDALVRRLEEQYVVRIVSRPGEQSGVDRYEHGRLSGYYLIVEALAENDRIVPRRIKNAETQRAETVDKWGEQVPEAVWNRIVADKQADGVVDENLFARKTRGLFAETIVLDDGTGRPMRRGRQITQW